jgi:carboxymethylenebutenolidase
MFRSVFAISATLTIATSAYAQTGPAADPHAGHAMAQQPPASAPADGPRNPNLPPDNAAAPEQLKSSPRHGEWVDIKNGTGAPIKSFVVYPERKDKAPVVIVIHEIFGLSDWVRGVADQLAKEGFIAIAPDFLSGKGPNGGGSDSLGQNVGQAIRTLQPADTNAILDAVRAYALTIPASNQKVATIGFCWGGGTSFRYAISQPALNAAVSYYGPMPTDPADYAKAKAPILGLYGGNDNRVNATIDPAKAELAKHNVTYEPHIFDGAGHGFLRQQTASDQAPGNAKATEQAWPLTLEFLRKYTK